MMETEKKNSKSLIILIIVLVIMLLGLSGYVIYDKLLINNAKKITTLNNNENKKTISESEALSIGNELWEYAHSTFWYRKPAWEVTTSNDNECDANNVSKIKEKYAVDFKANDTLDSNYTLDTFMHCSTVGRGGDAMYKKTSLKVKDIQENKIIFTAKSEYCGSSFCLESKDTTEVIEKDFIIIKQNNNWVISYFYLPD